MEHIDVRTPTVRRQVAATPREVWSVLSDGWLFPSWVVGAARMREVDTNWPAPGTRLHHSVGGWPVMLDDRTEVIESEPERLLVLRAHAWPAGAAEVRIALDGQSAGTLVSLSEDAVAGPAAMMPRLLRQAAITPRNREVLHRLACLAEGRTRTGDA